jgi:hypothetical protein
LWIGFICLRMEMLMGCYEHGNVVMKFKFPWRVGNLTSHA